MAKKDEYLAGDDCFGWSWYWINRKIISWVAERLGQQCSGKMRSGYAAMWCRFRLGHDGMCEQWDGTEFSDETEMSLKAQSSGDLQVARQKERKSWAPK